MPSCQPVEDAWSNLSATTGQKFIRSNNEEQYKINQYYRLLQHKFKINWTNSKYIPIETFWNSADPRCWTSESLLFLGIKPNDLTTNWNVYYSPHKYKYLLIPKQKKEALYWIHCENNIYEQKRASRVPARRWKSEKFIRFPVNFFFGEIVLEADIVIYSCLMMKTN